MANKQPLLEHEGGSWTDSSERIKSKIHEACCKNETHFLLERRNDIKAKKLNQLGSLFVAINNDNLQILDGLLYIGCKPDSAFEDALHSENLTKRSMEKTSKTFSIHRKMFNMILKAITSNLFASKVGFLLV